MAGVVVEIVRVDQERNQWCWRNQLAQKLQALGPERVRDHRYAGQVTARPIKAGNEAASHWIATGGEDDRHSRGDHPQGADRNIGGTCEDHRHFALHQVGRQFREAIKLTIRPAEFDRNILAVDVASFVERPVERRHHVRIRSERPSTQEPDHRHCRLLGTCGERHRHCTNQRTEKFPPPHVRLPASEEGIVAVQTSALIEVKKGPSLPQHEMTSDVRSGSPALIQIGN